jgi:hypothetical protein
MRTASGPGRSLTTNGVARPRYRLLVCKSLLGRKKKRIRRSLGRGPRGVYSRTEKGEEFREQKRGALPDLQDCNALNSVPAAACRHGHARGVRGEAPQRRAPPPRPHHQPGARLAPVPAMPLPPEPNSRASLPLPRLE